MNILRGLEPIEPENYEGITFSLPTHSTKKESNGNSVSSRGGKKFRVRPEILTAGANIHIFFLSYFKNAIRANVSVLNVSSQWVIKLNRNLPFPVMLLLGNIGLMN